MRILALALSCAALAGPAAAACASSGVITRIDGRPQDVVITRQQDGGAVTVPRPRVLEVMCAGDVVRVLGGSSVTIAVDGRGAVKVVQAGAFTMPARSGGPSLAGNAYRALNDQVMPDMKRLPWNVRLKGEGDDFGFALPGLTAGGESLAMGRRALLVRVVGGIAPYRVELRDAAGAVVATRTDEHHAVLLPAADLRPGAYRLTVSDASPRTVSADLTAVAGAPPVDPAFADMPDPEVRAAAAATALAQAHPGAWAFEAEQILNAAPANGLDRDRVYELVESYGSE
jgi:hypothetical protein